MKNLKHRMWEYQADRLRENEISRDLRSYKKFGLYVGITYLLLCGACMLIDKPKYNYQNLPISTNSVATNTIDDKVEK